MSIVLSGDFHANAQNELSVITQESLMQQYGPEKYGNIRYHIILGDGGFMWPGNRTGDASNYRALARRPFPVLCVIGNHEPILGMNDVPEADIGIGETVRQIQDEPFVAYLKRGKIYTIDGFRFLVLGGALSIDKKYRTPHVTWWEGEYWSEQEQHDLFTLLETENAFDGVLSHTGPHRVNKQLFDNPLFQKFPDKVAFLNDAINSRIQCRSWWCGHWHHDVYYHDKNANRSYHYLYQTTAILDRQDGKTVVYGEDGLVYATSEN